MILSGLIELCDSWKDILLIIAHFLVLSFRFSFRYQRMSQDGAHSYCGYVDEVIVLEMFMAASIFNKSKETHVNHIVHLNSVIATPQSSLINH
jgi:hypothetical protein